MFELTEKEFEETEQREREKHDEKLREIKSCSNCRHFAKPYELCCYSLGDEDYDCHGRKWESEG